MSKDDLSQTLKAGTLLLIAIGEYSDYGVYGPVRMLKDAVKADLAEAYRIQWTPDPDERGWRTGPDGYGFLAWLVKAGWAEAVDNVHEWHVGSYGRFEP